LRNSESWTFNQQVEFGDNLFKLLLQIYREIQAEHTGVISESDEKELTILGRKISSFYLKKENKIPTLLKTTGTFNISDLIFNTSYYIRRSNTSYEKIIARTGRLLTAAIKPDND
jgi:hypothetical protein